MKSDLQLRPTKPFLQRLQSAEIRRADEIRSVRTADIMDAPLQRSGESLHHDPFCPMSDPFDSSRREFLSGRAAMKEAARTGSAVADAITDGADVPPEPSAHDTIRLETRAMGCPWCVIMEPGPPEQVMQASAALEIVHALDAQLSVYRDDSEVSRVNRAAAGAPIEVEPGLLQLLLQCRRLSEETAAAFDPAVRALILLWRRCRQEGRVPDQSEVDVALSMAGMRHVLLDESTPAVSILRQGVGFDLGAIGKGYALDRASAELGRLGMQDFLLHGGHSSLMARGEHHEQAGWPVGLRDPLFTEQHYATILLRNQALATSGSNVQFFRHRGRRYGHILDPRTGWPAAGLLSATVVAPTAAEADALSTAFYVMGLEKALRYCDNHPAIGTVLVPPPAGRELQPIIRNIPADVLFLGTKSTLPVD
jgi:thiamine biosynthesis lipoprotein